MFYKNKNKNYDHVAEILELIYKKVNQKFIAYGNKKKDLKRLARTIFRNIYIYIYI